MSSEVSLLDAYAQKYARSASFYERGQQYFPDGVTHDGRYLKPFPVYVTHAHGARKISVEGHAIIDYWMGHGALLLGHSHPAVVRAVQEQIEHGTHYSACHVLELEWAQRIQSLMPFAEKIRFTSSGTEATLMAVRVARQFTGRRKVVKFLGHFHGWNDMLIPGAYPPYSSTDLRTPGITDGVLRDIIVIPPNDPTLVERVLEQEQPASLIVEPTGGHWGCVPLQPGFLYAVRQLTEQYGTLLIFDEVITGFRVHPGGAQTYFGIKPDLFTLAKIVAGGLPGGALAGRADVMDVLSFSQGLQKLRHPGTFNANPLSAAAGCAALGQIKHGTSDNPCEVASLRAAELRHRLNQLFRDQRIPWFAYGTFSMIHLCPNYEACTQEYETGLPYEADYQRLDGARDPHLQHALRIALLTEGVDWFGWGGMTSAVHTSDDIEFTIDAFERAFHRLCRAGWVKTR